MQIEPSKSKEDHRRALKEIEALMSAKFGTPEGDRLDLLVTLVEAYESEVDPIDLQLTARSSNFGTLTVFG